MGRLRSGSAPAASVSPPRGSLSSVYKLTRPQQPGVQDSREPAAAGASAPGASETRAEQRHATAEGSGTAEGGAGKTGNRGVEVAAGSLDGDADVGVKGQAREDVGTGGGKQGGGVAAVPGATAAAAVAARAKEARVSGGGAGGSGGGRGSDGEGRAAAGMLEAVMQWPDTLRLSAEAGARCGRAVPAALNPTLTCGTCNHRGRLGYRAQALWPDPAVWNAVRACGLPVPSTWAVYSSQRNAHPSCDKVYYRIPGSTISCTPCNTPTTVHPFPTPAPTPRSRSVSPSRPPWKGPGPPSVNPTRLACRNTGPPQSYGGLALPRQGLPPPPPEALPQQPPAAYRDPNGWWHYPPAPQWLGVQAPPDHAMARLERHRSGRSDNSSSRGRGRAGPGLVAKIAGAGDADGVGVSGGSGLGGPQRAEGDSVSTSEVLSTKG